MGDAKNDELRVGFDSRLKLTFCGSKVTSDDAASYRSSLLLSSWNYQDSTRLEESVD